MKKIERKLRGFIGRFMARPSTLYMEKKGKANPLCVEIGVFRGDNSKTILKRLRPKKLYLVDPWDSSKGYDEYTRAKLKRVEKEARRKFSSDGNVIIIKEDSKKLKKLIKEKVDFIYIDGNHTYDYVVSDMENGWDILNKKGVMSGHDITLHDVCLAFCEFVSKRKKEIKECKCKKNDWIIQKK